MYTINIYKISKYLKVDYPNLYKKYLDKYHKYMGIDLFPIKVFHFKQEDINEINDSKIATAIYQLKLFLRVLLVSIICIFILQLIVSLTKEL